MKLKTARLACLGTMAAGIVFAVAFFIRTSVLFGVLSILLFMTSTLLQAGSARCPHCRQPIRLWEFFRTKCPYCGNLLYEEDDDEEKPPSA